eukprot:5653823-Lingulodinium_polyedra.AAC.1
MPRGRSHRTRRCWCKRRRNAWPSGLGGWAIGDGARPQERSRTSRLRATGTAHGATSVGDSDARYFHARPWLPETRS